MSSILSNEAAAPIVGAPRIFGSAAPIWIMAIVVMTIMGAGVFAANHYLPQSITAAALDSAYRSNIEIADQIKITRGYYTQNVVAKSLKIQGLTATMHHRDNAIGIPLPATFVKDISDLLKERETSLTLVSPYPWPHRADRKMDAFEQEAWDAFQKDPSKAFSRLDVRADGARVLKVAVADRMTSQTCVTCHNTHPESAKKDWKIGDVRAVMQVTKLVEPILAAAQKRSQEIVWSIAAIAGLAAATLLLVTSLLHYRTRLQQASLLEQSRLAAAGEKLRLDGVASESASKAKSQFLATLSHEIRTPMHGILGTLNLLSNAGLSGKQALYCKTAHDSARALLGILNDTLDYSKLEAGRLELEQLPFDLHHMAKSVGTLFQATAEEKGIAISIDVEWGVPQRMIGDEARLRQILLNLVGNAIKFTESGQIRVRVYCLDGTEDIPSICFEVCDTGFGIAPERQAQLFTAFSQGDAATTRRFGGTGLGLSISKSLADLMGGALRVASEVGKGSTFTLEVALARHVPVQGDVEACADAGRPSMGDIPCLRILVAEDNAVNQLVAYELLGGMGHTVELARNGEEAIRAVRLNHYDVVLMDVEMPEKDGLMATREIRALDCSRKNIPIIALTANASPVDRNRCLAAGMTNVVSKPFMPDTLVAAIGTAIGVARVLSVARNEQDESSPLDFDRISALKARNPVLLSKLIEIYLDFSLPLLQSMRDGAAINDRVAMQLAAHSLKSCSANVGASRLAYLCHQLEVRARDGSGVDCCALVEVLEVEFRSVAAALNAEVMSPRLAATG